MRVRTGQPNAGFRRALPWPDSATAQLSGALSVHTARMKPVLNAALFVALP